MKILSIQEKFVLAADSLSYESREPEDTKYMSYRVGSNLVICPYKGINPIDRSFEGGVVVTSEGEITNTNPESRSHISILEAKVKEIFGEE